MVCRCMGWTRSRCRCSSGVQVYGLEEEQAVDTWEKFLDKEGKLADAVIIATQDKVMVVVAITMAMVETSTVTVTVMVVVMMIMRMMVMVTVTVTARTTWPRRWPSRGAATMCCWRSPWPLLRRTAGGAWGGCMAGWVWLGGLWQAMAGCGFARCCMVGQAVVCLVWRGPLQEHQRRL